jgi:hypothetical protein
MELYMAGKHLSNKVNFIKTYTLCEIVLVFSKMGDGGQTGMLNQNIIGPWTGIHRACSTCSQYFTAFKSYNFPFHRYLLSFSA